jgi:hypothetical protein
MSSMEPDEGDRQVDDEAGSQGTERGAWQRAEADEASPPPGDDAGEDDDEQGTERGAWQ